MEMHGVWEGENKPSFLHKLKLVMYHAFSLSRVCYYSEGMGPQLSRGKGWCRGHGIEFTLSAFGNQEVAGAFAGV